MSETGITQAFLIFQDVFVPMERVFLCGEYQYAGNVIRYFTANYRACIGACVAGQGDVMIGAAVLIARANGLSAKTFESRITEMAVNNETTFGLGIGAMALGRRHPAGVWISNSLLAHTNKVQVATLPYVTKRICQEIGAGPRKQDVFQPMQISFTRFTAPLFRKRSRAAAAARRRGRALRVYRNG